MRVLRILPPEIGEELAALELQIGRERGGLEIGFFQLDSGSIVFVQLEDDIGKSLEIRVHRPIEGNFRVAERKAAFDGIVIAKLKKTGGIGCGGPTEVHERIEAEIHVR